jgi:arylformamidase
MNQDSAEFQYVTGQMRESFGPLLADFEQRNTRALALPHWELDMPYGAHARQVMDVRPADGKALGTLVYFHAGYWQSRDKSQFRFLAPAFNAMGFDTVLVNYPLCPEVSVASIVASAAQALRQVAVHQSARGRFAPIVLCGHSAGAHLAIELALQTALGLRTSSLPLAGVVGISGVYDLQPLLTSSLNIRLNLNTSAALDCSPTHRVQPGCAPALFIWGETETPAFHSQSQNMARLWQQQGNAAQCSVVPDADHFSVLCDITAPNGLMAQAIQSWISV